MSMNGCRLRDVYIPYTSNDFGILIVGITIKTSLISE